MKIYGRGGGLAALSIRHPIGVVMITLAAVVLGAVSLLRLDVNLLPNIIYPEVRVRINDPGVPATVMEDQVTRQLEEQLAITEDAISVQSETSEGASRVNLSFQYGKDVDIALRDASTRLDRAKRFLPDSIDPPIIFKFDPAQLPVLEYVVSSALRDPVELREWVDYVFSKWFINLPGVAAAEVGGGLIREIQVLPDQQRLAGLGLSVDDVIAALDQGNREEPAGRLTMAQSEISSRTAGRFNSVAQIATLPLKLGNGESIPLIEVAQVLDSHGDERLRVRLNGVPGIKLTLQKQPTANTVAVADAVTERMAWLREQGIVPEDIEIHKVGDQSIFVRNSLNNAALAALSGALLAMCVVYIFLGNLRRTLIIGSAIPVAALVTLGLLEVTGLSLNIMTLGGLAVGVGMLVDSTVVMLENIVRHQREGEAAEDAGVHAAAEVNSAIVASTSTNLAAVLPFLFIGGLVGLLFRELIITISAAIVAAMFVALTLVPALGTRVAITPRSRGRKRFDGGMQVLRTRYAATVGWVLARPWRQLGVVLAFIAALAVTLPALLQSKEIFLPSMDDGRIRVRITGDPGINVDTMDRAITKLEALLHQEPEVDSVFSIVGGFIFGRTQREVANRTSMVIQLVPPDQRTLSADAWVKQMRGKIAKAQFAGLKVNMSPFGVRGIRTSRGDEDLSLRVQGPDLKRLDGLASEILAAIRGIPGLNNLESSSEDQSQELAIEVDRERAAVLGLSVEQIGRALRIALNGVVVTDYLDGDRAFDVRVQLPKQELTSPQDMEAVILFPEAGDRAAVHLGDVANVRLVSEPAVIKRDFQRRIVEISGTFDEGVAISEVAAQITARLATVELPSGYSVYDAGNQRTLQEGHNVTLLLLGLALFLVFVVMAVQYESLRNPLVILLGVPFAIIGVDLGLLVTGLPLSMPVWLGIIMLAGIVVNNAIILVEYVELRRAEGCARDEAIQLAASLRLRPILMTTLTTTMGLMPLAFGIGEGAEMLQPLAVTIVSGLSFSLLVSLLLIPVFYRLLHPEAERVLVAEVEPVHSL